MFEIKYPSYEFLSYKGNNQKRIKLYEESKKQKESHLEITKNKTTKSSNANQIYDVSDKQFFYINPPKSNCTKNNYNSRQQYLYDSSTPISYIDSLCYSHIDDKNINKGIKNHSNHPIIPNYEDVDFYIKPIKLQKYKGCFQESKQYNHFFQNDQDINHHKISISNDISIDYQKTQNHTEHYNIYSNILNKKENSQAFIKQSNNCENKNEKFDNHCSYDIFPSKISLELKMNIENSKIMIISVINLFNTIL